MRKKKIGIYCIENLVNKKRYVGKSKDIETRWRKHRNGMINGWGKKKNLHLYCSWYKYGEQNFEFSIIEFCILENLDIREQYWIDYYKSYDPEKGYNNVRYMKEKIIFSNEHREKISKSHIGIQSGENHPMYGKHHSEESKKKISENNKGKIPWNKGKKMTEKQMEKMKLNRLKGENHPFYGKSLSQEIREKISKTLKGHCVQETSKLKMSESHKGLQSGENHPRSKLTWEQVREIRNKYKPHKYTIRMLIEEYNVSKGCILHIIYNKTWKEKNE